MKVIINKPNCLLLATDFMYSISQNKDSFPKFFNLSEIIGGRILNNDFRRRPNIKGVNNMAIFRNKSQYFFFKILSGNITWKIEVQKDLMQYIDVTIKYFKLITNFDYNFQGGLFHYITEIFIIDILSLKETNIFYQHTKTSA